MAIGKSHNELFTSGKSSTSVYVLKTRCSGSCNISLLNELRWVKKPLSCTNTTVNDFKNLSGLEINATKTEGMWLGSRKNNLETPFGFRWPRDPIKVLGIFFSNDSHKATE